MGPPQVAPGEGRRAGRAGHPGRREAQHDSITGEVISPALPCRPPECRCGLATSHGGQCGLSIVLARLPERQRPLLGSAVAVLVCQIVPFTVRSRQRLSSPPIRRE
jgi:hypothetical protein